VGQQVLHCYSGDGKKRKKQDAGQSGIGFSTSILTKNMVTADKNILPLFKFIMPER
jgi:Tat protein secretion system quality control protein TatD with DNase activity